MLMVELGRRQSQESYIRDALEKRTEQCKTERSCELELWVLK